MNNWWTDIRSSFKQQHQQQQQQQQQQKTIVKRPIMERCASLISELIDSWLIWKWPPYANELCYQAAAISLQAELFQAVSQQHPSALIGSLNCYSFIRELCRVSFFLFCFCFCFLLFWFEMFLAPWPPANQRRPRTNDSTAEIWFKLIALLISIWIPLQWHRIAVLFSEIINKRVDNDRLELQW